MPTARRARTIEADPEAVWSVVSDPDQLPRWWPDVVRVEEASPAAWTKVLSTRDGKTLRADFTRVSAQAPSRLVWRQELAESPFERLLSEALTEIDIEDDGEGRARVELRATQRPRGMARFGALMFQRASSRKLDEALDGLERAVGR